MPDHITPSELSRLQSYMPPGWREQIESSLVPDDLTGYVSYLQELLSAVGTYLPRAVLVGDQRPRVGQGVFRYGTMLFADVSGFSTLTERFSQERGREGAEEITLIVNCFLEIVNGIAVQYGGDLLKFAGDAALSFYSGEDHAARGCRAAWEMQEAVQARFANVRTSLGEFPLRMSIGLGSGDALMASLGTSDNAEYAVMGPAMAAMGQAELLAQAGHIVIDRTTRELAGKTISVATRGEGFFQLSRADPRPGAVERPDLRLVPPGGSPQAKLRWLLARVEALAPYLPPGLLEKLIPSPAQIGVESDHRWVTTVFADLRGVNALVEALGTRREGLLTEAVNSYFLAMRKVVQRYEGVLHKVGVGPTGPHLFITFGAPKSHPDDPERAVRAALGMQETLAGVNQEVASLLEDVPDLRYPFLRQAIGITTGFVFASSVGSARRWEYTVMGDVVNLSSRLMSAAADGEILVSDSTARYLRGRFDLCPKPAIRVKGKRKPVSYAQVTGLAQLPSILGVAEGQLVGRQAELDAAQTLLDRAIGGSGGVLAVHGEAGMGKTRLAQEIVRQAQEHGMRVIAGTCLSYGGDIPYLPWIDVLRALLGIAAAERGLQSEQLVQGLESVGLAGWGSLIAEPLGLEASDTELTASLDPRLRQQRLFDIVLELVSHHARSQPLLLVIEDVHWADPTSLELLDYVARNVASCSTVLLILHRPRERLDGRWQKLEHAAEISLRELPSTAVRGLIAGFLGTESIPDQLAELVLRKAQGNPFFTEEVVRALIDADVLKRNGHWMLVADPDQAGVPDTIHGVIQSRVDRLEETDRRVLQVASVIGRVFSASILSGVYPYDDLDGTLPQCMSRLGSLGLVLLEQSDPEPIYMFKHALTQDVAYESLSYARRREVHRRVGTFVEAQGGESVSERPGFLAHHFFQGQAWREASTYSLVAGRKAKREYANEAAIAHFGRVLQAVAKLDEPCEEEKLEAQETLGEVLTLVGRYDEALAHLEEARPIVATWPSTERRNHRLAGLCSEMASAYEAKGDYDTALEQLVQGLTAPTVSQRLEGARLYLRGVSVFHRQADYDQAETWCRQGLAIAEQVGGQEGRQVMARGYYLLGGIQVRRGDLDEAISWCQQSLLLYEELGDLFGQAQAHTNLAMAYYYQDRWDLAARHHTAAMNIAEQIGYAEGQARAASNLGGIYLVQGKADAAREQYHVALDTVDRLGMTYGVALMHNNLGAVCVRGGKWDEAAEHLERSLALFEEIGSEEFLAELFRYRAEIALGQQEMDQALAYARRSLDYAQAHEMRLEEGTTWRVLGRAHRERAELEPAEEALARALEIAQEAHKRHETALTRLELARLRVQQGEEEAGRELARQAAQVLGELGARLDLEEAESLLQPAL